MVWAIYLIWNPPAATPHSAHPTRRRQRRYPIEADTPIVPRAVAVSVWAEACEWLDKELPRSWIAELTERANVIYARNSRFRRTIRRPGNAGRDWLWVFTRHWLSAMLREHDGHLYARLPASYSAGRDLPNHASAPAVPKKHPNPKKLVPEG